MHAQAPSWLLNIGAEVVSPPPKNSMIRKLNERPYRSSLPQKKCIKGGGWGEVGCILGCHGFAFVVNVCSLPLPLFLAVV